MIPKRPNGLNYDCMGVWSDKICDWCIRVSRCSATKTIHSMVDVVLLVMLKTA